VRTIILLGALLLFFPQAPTVAQSRSVQAQHEDILSDGDEFCSFQEWGDGTGRESQPLVNVVQHALLMDIPPPKRLGLTSFKDRSVSLDDTFLPVRSQNPGVRWLSAINE